MTKFSMNAKLQTNPIFKEYQISKETQIKIEPQISKETQLANEPQIL
jgi:hypothetical protein